MDRIAACDTDNGKQRRVHGLFGYCAACPFPSAAFAAKYLQAIHRPEPDSSLRSGMHVPALLDRRNRNLRSKLRQP
jgi:hypothetical protein